MNEFTYKDYGLLLDRLHDAGYIFCGYHNVVEDSPVCVLRHDLDLDVQKALRIAEVEYKKEISSTYCIMVRSDVYNPFSKKNTDLIKKIIDMNHYIGLHFDCESYNHIPTIEKLSKACSFEVFMLENWFSLEVKLVSYHKPNALVLSGTPEISAPIPHAYIDKFLHEMTYLSDSYGFWRFGYPTQTEAFLSKKSLNINIHPIWWSEEESSALYALTLAMRKKKAEMREYMLTNIVGV